MFLLLYKFLYIDNLKKQIVMQSDEICTTHNLFFQDHYGTKQHRVGM